MMEQKLSIEQWQAIEKLEQSLDSLYNWINELQQNDTELRNIIWQKIQAVTNRLNRLLNNN